VQNTGQSAEAIRLERVGTIDPGIDGIIICGTALADTWYQSFSLMPFLVHWTGPVLGICAGMQMLLTETGGIISPHLEIGMIPVSLTGDGREHPLTKGKDDFSGYALHQFMATLSSSKRPLAVAVAECAS